MNLLESVINCSDEKLDKIIEKALHQKNDNSNKIEKIGFVNGTIGKVTIFSGFIPFETRINYSTLSMGNYSMKTTDFYYDFARQLRKNNIRTRDQFILFIELYINSYFGLNKTCEDKRDKILDDIAFQTTTTDDEYFEKLENNEIGSLKGMNVAMCTERAAMAQNLLSLYDFDTYYCMGYFDNDGYQERHCFNIVKEKNGYVLLDYSVPVVMFDKGVVTGYLPFKGQIDEEEFQMIQNNQQIKSFQNYEYIKTKSGYQKTFIDTTRSYTVGSWNFEKQASHKG